MKKIISVIAISTLLATGTFGQVNAMSDGEMGNGNMMNQNGGMMGNGNMDMTGKSKMGMMNMGSPEMMKKREEIMKKISDSLDEEGRIKLEEMRKEHMGDMMEMMKDSSDMDKKEEKHKGMEKMKKEHFSDLKELLKDNNALYIEVSKEMELLMDSMMKNMESHKGMGMGKGNMMNQSGGMKMGMMNQKSGMMGNSNMNMGGVNTMKKRLFSSKTQNKMDRLIDKLFIKLDNLDSEKKTGKIKGIILKIEKAKSKYKNKDEVKKAKMYDILDYLKEKLSEKSGMNMGNGNIGMRDGGMNIGGANENSVLMESTENLMKAKKVEVVELKDGDTYTMEVTQVEKEIGNAKVVMLAYNGSIPGPVIKVAKDSRITLKFVNKVKGLKTTLHSHGLRLDNGMDGVPDTMRGKQKEMEFGDTFEYTLDFPDEGVYWYHPHVREDLQQELGLYGNYIVEPTTTNYWAKVNREETLILDDILMDNDKIASITDKFANYVMMGRYGNTMLVNGDTNYDLKVKKGESVRMYFTNVANTRVFQVAIPGAKMKLVGGDIGKYEREEMIDSFVMAPAERYIVDVYFDKAGKFDILNKNPEFTRKLGSITVSENSIDTSYKTDFETLRVNDDVISDIDNFRKYFDTKPDKYLDLSIGMKGMKTGSMGSMGGESDGDKIEWSDKMGKMNKMSNSDGIEWKLIDRENGNENMDINWKFKVGDKVKVRIYNDPDSMHPMQHPIHFHGQRFLVVSENGKTPDNMVWKDTALVKTGEYIDIVIDMTNPGDWMSHCHIAEHLSAGMMMSFNVSE